MPLSNDLAAKSVQAAVAAIEIYNKPSFSYREEAFSLLMTNAWELLLKAKWLVDHGEAVETLYEMTKDKAGDQRPKENRSGNPISVGLTYLAAAMVGDKKTGLEKAAQENLLALVEIRDNSAHLINKDPYIGRRVQEVGTASLRNYLLLAASWFKLDMSEYNFFLMPISFYHGFEAAEPATRADYPVQIQKLLAYLDAREATDFTRSVAETGAAASQAQEEKERAVIKKRKLYNLLRKINCIRCEFRFPPGPQDACFNTPVISQINKDIESIRDALVELLDLPEARALGEARIHSCASFHIWRRMGTCSDASCREIWIRNLLAGSGRQGSRFCSASSSVRRMAFLDAKSTGLRICGAKRAWRNALPVDVS